MPSHCLVKVIFLLSLPWIVTYTVYERIISMLIDLFVVYIWRHSVLYQMYSIMGLGTSSRFENSNVGFVPWSVPPSASIIMHAKCFVHLQQFCSLDLIDA